MKCGIDNKSPRQATHLKTKAKKNTLMEDRFTQIEKENRLLLEKMSNIMRVSSISTLVHWSLLLLKLGRDDSVLLDLPLTPIDGRRRIVHVFVVSLTPPDASCGGVDCPTSSLSSSPPPFSRSFYFFAVRGSGNRWSVQGGHRQ